MRPTNFSRTRVVERPGIRRLTILASGDFACNLYWQSVSLFLLFFYTDVLRLSPATAGLLYMVGALWDGMADLGVSIILQRRQISYRRVVTWAAVPLGIAFAGMYANGSTILAILAAQMAFRTLYAVVNVPYIAWSARISDDSRDRAWLAGLRMLFGTFAATMVAIGTPRLAELTTGGGATPYGFLTAAIMFAVLATPILITVAQATPETAPAARTDGTSSALAGARALIANRAFVTLNVAAMASTVAAAVLGQSVLYYFSHVVGDATAGPHTLAAMGIAGTAATILWMAAAVRIGARKSWLIAATAGVAFVAGFAASGTADVFAATPFLIAMQVVLTGFNLCFWAMLPDTVDYGEHDGGPRVEAMAFGVAALLQKIALAGAAGAMGRFYAGIGYDGSAAVAATATAAGIRALMLWAPLVGLTLSGIVMIANPLRATAGGLRRGP